MTNKTNQSLWKKEFPDFDGMDFVMPEGFEDVSNKEEGMPTFENTELGLMIHVDYVDPALREAQGGKRFALLEEGDDRCGSADPCIAESDNFEDIRVEIENYRASNSPSPAYV